MLFVGWFLQFAVGVAYWLLPRKRTPAQPLGYRVATVAVVALNLGLGFQVLDEPVERTGRGTGLSLRMLAASALLQIGAVLIFAIQLWTRVGSRAPRPKNDAMA